MSVCLCVCCWSLSQFLVNIPWFFSFPRNILQKLVGLFTVYFRRQGSSLVSFRVPLMCQQSSSGLVNGLFLKIQILASRFCFWSTIPTIPHLHIPPSLSASWSNDMGPWVYTNECAIMLLPHNTNCWPLRNFAAGDARRRRLNIKSSHLEKVFMFPSIWKRGVIFSTISRGWGSCFQPSLRG